MVVVREFLSALGCSATYDPRGNTYMLFGVLWGVPVPLLALLLETRAGLGAHQLLEPGWLLVNGLLLLHPVFFGVVFGALGTVRRRKDIQVRELMHQKEQDLAALEVAHAELLDVDRVKDELLGNVSHELKTPLVTVRGYAEMLASGRLGEVNERQTRALGVIQRGATRLQARIEDVLAAARPSEALTSLEMERLDLADLVEEVTDLRATLAQDRGLELRVELPDQPVAVLGDHQRLREVLTNLLDNALKFTTEGHVALRFAFSEEGVLVGEVSDTGCGIPAEAQAHIFERFRQADGSIRRQYGGTGLGLAIVRANLQAHGCDVQVRSAPGQGATFTFELPIAGGPTPPAGPDTQGDEA